MARVFSGMKPTGDATLGSYLGALRNWVDDQGPEAVYCVVDLHALTTPQDPVQLRADSLDLATTFLAVGIDPTESIVFVQSHVHEHSELAWLMECTAAIGELRRMTQFKDKSAKAEEGGGGFVSGGLLTYPALMAADILLYDTDEVPVGDDQRQHVELTRDLAIRFNSRYGDTFVVPKATIRPAGARVMDLQDPTRKMSKSEDSPAGTILLLEEPGAVAKKIKRAVTDTEAEVRYDPAAKPGVSNLLSILAASTGRTPQEAAEGYTQYGPLKSDTADAVVELLAPIRARHAELAADPAEVARILQDGAARARKTAATTLARAREAVGLAVSPVSSPLRTAPWTRALGLIWRHPAVVAGVVGGCAVLGAAAAAPALFVSSAANAAQATQVEARCAGTIGATIDQAADIDGFDRAVRAVAATEPGVGTPIATFSSQTTAVTESGDVPTGVTFISRTGALDHVEELQGGGPAGGAWITQQTARQLGLRPGSLMHFRSVEETLPVTGIYRDLRPHLLADPFDPYWCSQASLLVPRGDYEDPPPPAVLLDRETFRRIGIATGAVTDGTGLGGVWELPVDLTKASDGARLSAFYDELPDLLEARLTADDEPHQPLEVARSALPFVVDRTTTLTANVRNAIQPVGIAGIITALLLVGAAGAYWVDRRRDEVTMLAVRGVGPGAIGTKALLESVLAALLGAAAGYGVAVLLVRAVGPSSLLDASAVADGARRAAVGLAIGLVLLAVVAGIRSRTLGIRRTRRSRLPLAWVPWEVIPLLLAWWSHRRLQAMGSPVASATEIPDVDLLALAFPLLFIVGTVAVAARLATATLRLLRDRGQRWPTWLFLAGRRLGATSHLAVILLAASATAVGVFVYAGTLTHTLDVTLDAKAQTARGSDVVVETVGPPTLPAAYRDRATVVRALIDTQLSSPQIDVIAVDPDTFARGVLWDDSFADQSLESLLGKIDQPAGPRGIPAILVNGGLPEGGALNFVDPRYPDLKIDPVATADVFPGVSRVRPLVVVTTTSLESVANRPVSQVWINGDSEGITQAFERAGNQVRFVTTTEGVLDQTAFLTVAWTFGFMQALGVLVGLITVGGLLLYLDTRQRSRRVSYAFLRRMGLSRRAHRRSIAAEVGVVVVGGTVLGAGLACAAAALVYLDLDPVPKLLPAPLLRFPSNLLLGVVLASIVVSWFGARVAQLSADRGDVAEVLRAEV